MPYLDEGESMRSIDVTDEEFKWVASMRDTKLSIWDLEERVRQLWKRDEEEGCKYTFRDIEGLHEALYEVRSIIGEEQ